MPDLTPYQIVVRGRPSDRLLRPFLDEFTITRRDDGTTMLAGVVRDPSHLHGLVQHLTSVSVEIVSINPA